MRLPQSSRSGTTTTTPIIVVGAGLSGAVSARLLAERGYNVFLIDKRDHIAGNCFDYTNQYGIRVSQYGAHLFHTNSHRVWKFVNNYSHWVRWEHTVLANIQDKLVPVPPNITTVNTLFNQSISSTEEMEHWLKQERQAAPETPTNGEQAAIARVGNRLYEAIFKHYTFKQWAKYPHELEPSVLQRLPLRNNWDTRYFNDKYQALPAKGYTEFIANMLEHPLIHIHLSVDFFELRKAPTTCATEPKKINCVIEMLRELVCDECCKVVFTGPIDSYFYDAGLPKLEYRSINFETQHLNMEGFYQPNAVVNFPSADTGSVTRIVEYKHFLNQKSTHTTIVSETTKDDGDPYYPVPNAKNRGVYRMYQKLAEAEKDVYFLGRLASYKYFNMDQAILNALEFWDTRLL